MDIDELIIMVDNSKKAEQDKSKDNDCTGELITFRMLERAGKLPLNVKDGIIYLSVSEIIRVESDGAYSTFYTSYGEKHVSSTNIGEYENLLSIGGFYRIHKSHLINIKKVKKYIRGIRGFIEMEDGSIVEMARRKKEDFLRRMSELN